MHPNDVQLVRVYTKENDPSQISDQTFNSGQSFVVVVEAEAGKTKFEDGGPYKITIVVHDLTANANIATPTTTGALGDAAWPTPALKYQFPPIPAQGAGKEGHIYDVTAFLQVGSKNPNVSFAVGPMFCITPP